MTWLRCIGFVLGLILAVMVASSFPGPGSRNGCLHPGVVNNVGIALILFLQGLSLALEKVKSGAGNDVSLILLPLIFYHPIQIFVNGLPANRWGNHLAVAPAGK